MLIIIDADEREDYLELRDPKVKNQIAVSRKDADVGRVRPAKDLLMELKGEGKRSKIGSRKRA